MHESTGARTGHCLAEQRELDRLLRPRTKLAAIWRLYGIASHPAGGDKALDHTLYTLLIDPKGRGRVVYDSTATSSIIDHDLRLVLGLHP